MKRKTQHFIFEGWNSLDTWTRMGVNCYNKRIGNGVEYDNDRMKAKVPILKKIKLRKKSNSNTSNTTNLKTLKITKDKSAKKTNRFTNKRNEMNEPNELNEPNQPNGPNDLNALNRPNKESRTNRMGRVLKGSKLFKRKIKAKDLIPATDDMPLAEPIKVKKFPFGSRLTQSGSFVRTKEFDDEFAYDGPLGAFYAKDRTLLRLWAPTAQDVAVEIWESLEEVAAVRKSIPMTYQDNGVWEVILRGDQHKTVYTYHLTFSDGTNHSSMDPYSRAVVTNGEKTVILDPEQLKIEDFHRLPPFSNPVDAVIYELHVRDFSSDPNSGIPHRGQFLGVIEPGTTNSNGSPTGLDYLKSLGITHVQLLPIYDYSTVDEYHPELSYNWGYDPKNYNVPEGSYSTDPKDPALRIIELKEMIKGLHQAGIRVIMDVVYNHVYEVSMHSLHKTTPGYFFRYDHAGKLVNGTGVGNDTASERYMMRKYIVDSIRYWLEEFNLDGFRFDLMGIHDVATMNEIRALADSIDPSIILLGEGWNLNTSLPTQEKAWQGNASQMPRIAHFNDTFRDAVKGSVFNPKQKGFVSGRHPMGGRLAESLVATNWPKAHTTYIAPDQIVQYVEAHDNLTLYDKLLMTDPKDSEAVRIRRHTLATSMVLLAEGIPFIHAGQEFLRTKGGDENSYRSAESINWLDWSRQDTYRAAVTYFKALVDLRAQHQVLRLRDSASILRNVSVLHNKAGIITLHLKDETEELLVTFNGNKRKTRTILLPGIWQVLVRDGTVYNEVQEIHLHNGQIQIEPLSVLVLKRVEFNGWT